MGYRHIVISDVHVPKCEEIPKWFEEKYEGVIDFSGNYWKSFNEYKRYGLLRKFEEDVQEVIIELGWHDIILVFFSDEDSLDVSHVTVSSTGIEEVRMI
jgi:hypothetical protein